MGVPQQRFDAEAMIVRVKLRLIAHLDMILLQIIFDFRRQQLRKVADHAVRADQIRRFALFHLFILHSDQLAHLPLRLPDQNFIIKQHKRRVNSHADCDIHNLKHHSGP